jgi:gas vesicle protein
MPKKNLSTHSVEAAEPSEVSPRTSTASIAWAITIGVLFGAIIGAVVGISLRPKKDLTELSHEWLEEFKEVTDRVSGRVRSQVRELVSKKLEPSEGYEEYPESYV